MSVTPSSQLVRPSWIAQLTLHGRAERSVDRKLRRTRGDLHAAGEEDDERLKRVEVKVERLTDRPPEKDEDGDDKERDLDRRADRDRQTEVQLVLGRDGDGLRAPKAKSDVSCGSSKRQERRGGLTVTCSAALPTTGNKIRLKVVTIRN